MPARPTNPEQLQRVVDAWLAHGRSQKDAAAAIGMNYHTFRSQLDCAKRKGLHLSDGAREVVERVRLDGMEAQGGWIHDYVVGDDGKRHKVGTTRWKAVSDSSDEDTLARIRNAFEGMTPAVPVVRRVDVAEDKCNVLPLYDVHWGMAAWGEETGDVDYDLTLARDDMMRGLASVLADAPAAHTCVLIVGGDFLHADDNLGLTPHNKHSLDVIARQDRAIDSGIAILKYVVQRVLETCEHLVIRVLRGNHDENSHRTLKFALREWLRYEPRATVDMSAQEVFMFQWGRCSIFGQHGDKMSPEKLALKLADICPFWTAAPHRYAYTGHKHSMAAQRIGGLNWERLEPFAPSDAYGASWVNRRALKIDTYHKKRGRIGVVLDPLERD